MRMEMGDKIRIERSPYLNGHFYMRLRSKDEEMTLGFGYDEPYHDVGIMSNPILIQLRMASTILKPVKDMWVVYHHDHPRNNITHILPDLFHVMTNWFEISIHTANELNNLLNFENDYKKIFNKPFSAFAIEEQTHNCRTLILDVIQDSITKNSISMLGKYFYGNSLFNDHEHGCLIFDIDKGEVKKINHHPCCWLLPMPCCNCVCYDGKNSIRHPIISSELKTQA